MSFLLHTQHKAIQTWTTVGQKREIKPACWLSWKNIISKGTKTSEGNQQYKKCIRNIHWGTNSKVSSTLQNTINTSWHYTIVLCTHNINPPCRTPSPVAFIHVKYIPVWGQQRSLAQLKRGFMIPIIKWYLPLALVVHFVYNMIWKSRGRMIWLHECNSAKALALLSSPACDSSSI